MLMVRDHAVSVKRASMFASMRVQLLSLLIAGVVLPTAIQHPRFTESPETVHSMIGATLAIVAGLVLLRRVTAFPGTDTFGFILPSFAIPYGIVLTLFLGLRLEYSSVHLVLSFGLALLMAFISNFWVERNAVRRFHLVPFGRTELVSEIGDVEWVPMSEARVPADVNAAIVADLHFDLEPAWERMLAEAAVRGHQVYHTKQLRESLTGRVTIEHLSENSFGSLVPNLAYRKVKRVADFLAAIVLLLLLALPILVIAVLIRMDSKGPALFRQERMGHRGHPFVMLKFRTMRPRPEADDVEAARQDAMTQSDDLRITRIGQFLRRRRLDELPQIVNVLRGEMSLIGPRPEAVALSHWYERELPFYFYRHIVRPGISGWAQVHQGHVTDLEAVYQKLTYDFYYIKNFSAWLDILIALRTVSVMISGFGSK